MRHRLGLAEALRAAGVVSRSLDSRDWQSGALLGRAPLAAEAASRWGAPWPTASRVRAPATRVHLTEHMTSGGV
jgi:hypothetical protein